MHYLIIYEQPTPRSQFQHFAHLVDLDFPPNTHVMFTDDGDIWHPGRFLHYAEALLAARQQDVETLFDASRTFISEVSTSASLQMNLPTRHKGVVDHDLTKPGKDGRFHVQQPLGFGYRRK